MDFKASKEDEAFRLEVRKFIQDNWDSKGFLGHEMSVRSWDFDNPLSRENDKEFGVVCSRETPRARCKPASVLISHSIRVKSDSGRGEGVRAADFGEAATWPDEKI